MAEHDIRVGVGDLLEVLYHARDLGGSAAPGRGTEGTAGHGLLVSRRPEGYQSEVVIEHVYEWQDYRLTVKGRIDGVFEEAGGIEVEEIKTTYAAVSELSAGQLPSHEAQLRLYMYFMMVRHPEKRITGKLTYLSLADLSERSFVVETSQAAAEALFCELAEAFLSVYRERDEWRRVRDESLAALPFPFPDRRAGQDELMDMVNLALEQERDLFVEAATGIGKTIAVLYPALKRMALSDRYGQVFFLTAKTAGKEIIQKTLRTAAEQGLRLRTVFIEAKERVCQTPGGPCRPENCPYAADYYARAAELMPEVLAQELMTPDIVMQYARRDQVCPFELSLDLALKADLIVGDYNYVFDPRAYLRRFFLFSGRRDFLFLIDEAHNLVARGRDMYSSTLSRSSLAAMARDLQPAGDRLSGSITSLCAFLDGWQHEMDEDGRTGLRLNQLPEMLTPALEQLLARLEQLLKQDLPGTMRQQVLNAYFELSAFTQIAALVNENYAVYAKKDQDDVILRLLCLNPGPLLRKKLDSGRTAIFFSATLSPGDYFQELLGGGPDALSVRLPSPFPVENRLYMHVPGIDTRYRAREGTAALLAKCAVDMVHAHTGNYLMFFPSYAYLQAVAPLVKSLLAGKASIYIQYPSMGGAQKQEFLRRVTATGTGRSNLGLAILGGLFGEGVDMPGEQLVGVLIVGPGLPVVNEEQELIRMYFEERNNQGFLFAFLIPGLIRVIQSAGRVFRSSDDRGVVILVDDRFGDERYQELLPPDWLVPGRTFTCKNYRKALDEFWKD